MDEPCSALDPIATLQGRGADRRAQGALHDRDRHPQHAAGRARGRLDRVHARRRGGGACADQRRLHQAHATSAPSATSPGSSGSGSEMQETRHQFREDLKELERQVLGGLDLVIQQLDRALESVSYQDVELAGDGGRRRRPDRRALPGGPPGDPVAAGPPGAGGRRPADRRRAAARDPLHRADGRPVREHRQAGPAVGLRVAQGQGHPRLDRADGPAGPLAGVSGQGGAAARATSSWPRTWSARTPRSTGSTGRSSGARSRSATTSTCANGGCS